MPTGLKRVGHCCFSSPIIDEKLCIKIKEKTQILNLKYLDSIFKKKIKAYLLYNLSPLMWKLSC